MCVSLRAAFFSRSLNTDPCMYRSQRSDSRQRSVTRQQRRQRRRPNAWRWSALFTSSPSVCSGSECTCLTFRHLPLMQTNIVKSASVHREPLSPERPVSRDTFLTFLWKRQTGDWRWHLLAPFSVSAHTQCNTMQHGHADVWLVELQQGWKCEHFHATGLQS